MLFSERNKEEVYFLLCLCGEILTILSGRFCIVDFLVYSFASSIWGLWRFSYRYCCGTSIGVKDFIELMNDVFRTRWSPGRGNMLCHYSCYDVVLVSEQ